LSVDAFAEARALIQIKRCARGIAAARREKVDAAPVILRRKPAFSRARA